MTTDTPRKERAPFAAAITFKAGHFWQGKHDKYTFRSDLYCPPSAEASVHFKALEWLVFKHLNGTFLCASIFDNRLSKFVPGGTQPANNLILQVYDSYGQTVNIDKRKELDLSFLTPSFDRRFMEYMADEFAAEKRMIDMKASALNSAAQSYKEALNLNPKRP